MLRRVVEQTGVSEAALQDLLAMAGARDLLELRMDFASWLIDHLKELAAGEGAPRPTAEEKRAKKKRR